MEDKRFYIDERVGCIAIRDRKLIDPENKCLTANMPDIIKYWHGYQEIKRCPTCDHVLSNEWKVLEKNKQEAKKLCELLNNPTPEDREDATI